MISHNNFPKTGIDLGGAGSPAAAGRVAPAPDDAVLDLTRSAFTHSPLPSNVLSATTESATAPPEFEQQALRRFNNTILKLNGGIAAAAGVVIGTHGAIATTLLPQLIETAPTWLLVYGATVIGFGLATRAGFSQLATHVFTRRATDQEQHASSYQRVLDSLKRLAERDGKTDDIQVVVDKSEHLPAGLHTGLYSRNIMVLDNEFVKGLTDRELDAIVAHEISHAHRTFSKFGIAHSLLHCFSSPAVFWGTVLPVFSAVSQIGGVVVGAGVSLISATTTWVATFFSIGAVSAYISRSNELKTDLRAVRITRDPEAYISMLGKISAFARRMSKISDIQHIYSTHPSVETRCQKVREVFGAQQNSEPHSH